MWNEREKVVRNEQGWRKNEMWNEWNEEEHRAGNEKCLRNES